MYIFICEVTKKEQENIVVRTIEIRAESCEDAIKQASRKLKHDEVIMAVTYLTKVPDA